MRLLSRLAAAALGVALLAPLAGCGDSGTGTTAPAPGGTPGTGKLTLLLKDAPADIDMAVVTISQIYLQGANGRTVLRNTPVTVDLLTLRDSTASLLRDAEIPVGTYDELRFVVSGGYIKLADGKVYASSPDYSGLTDVPPGAPVTGTLQMPSFAQSGLKVKLPQDKLVITEQGQQILLVDFDVSQSFGHMAGQSGRWVMHPVCIATDVVLAAKIGVHVTLGQGASLPTGVSFADFRAQVSRDNGDGTTTVSSCALVPDQAGTSASALCDLLPAGTWSVTLPFQGGAPAVTLVTSPAQPASVTVAAGQTATVDFTVTAAAASIQVTAGLAQGVTLPAGTTFASFDAVLTRDNGDGTTTEFTAPLVPDQAGTTATVTFAGLRAAPYAASLRYTGPAPTVNLTTTPTQPAPITVAPGAAGTVTFSVTAAGT